ncbi:MAG: hypothetical protein M3Y24_02770 [Acidobacteriota bacterium]|nr:hypothetical protein [Acidobacteriota bacterium]
MHKCLRRLARRAVLPAALCISLLDPNILFAFDDSSPAQAYDVLATTLLSRAESEVAKIKVLVEQGTLPQVRLNEAEAQLADAQDQVVLARTLYGQTRLQDLTDAQANAMVEAARNRVDRQNKVVENRRTLVDTGIIAKSELADIEQELESRRRVLELAENRVRLLKDLRQMAENEQRLERAALQANGAALKDVMIRYDGNGLFNLGDLTTISSEFERKFHRALPVSALGQTLVHQSMGLDHRNRVDVALNPDGAEGIWLRHLLEKLHVPYLAFRNAVAGAATAPHIHIGLGSTRLTADHGSIKPAG